MVPSGFPPSERVIEETRQWLERAVIGLNLCPFAKAAHVKSQIHFVVSGTEDPEQVMEALRRELEDLVAAEPAVRETTLLIAPRGLDDFLAFHDFVGRGERLVARCGLEGVIQLASFHPHYQFAGVDEEDITNYTNRSPFPTLHLLREASVARAVETLARPDSIYEANMRRLQALGHRGWADLGLATR